MLAHRWYPYEQTVVMLLHAVFGRKSISRFFVGNISDLPEGRESLGAVWQQVERTERVLKSLWRERHLENAAGSKNTACWKRAPSKSAARALIILENLLA